MKHKFLLSMMVFVSFSLAACSLFPFGPATQMVPTSAPTSAGLPVSFGNVHLVIPPGLASGASFTTSVNVEYPYINPSFGDMPEHTVITLEGYSLAGKTGQLFIFYADQFAQYTKLTQKIIAELKALPTRSNTDVPADLATIFYAQTRFLASTEFYGIRYLTEPLNGFSPINNASVFYYYQGLSLDGKYYVEAIFPVNAVFLAPDANPDAPVPAGGIPFSVDSMTDPAMVQQYYNAVKDKLNTADASVFSPLLGTIDELIESIDVDYY